MTSIELRIRSIYDSLSNAEKKVADHLLNDVENVFNKPIAQLAQEAGVSKVAWVRFCKDIGYDGLKDLKKALFAQMRDKSDESMADPFSDVRDIADTKSLIEGIKHNSIRAIQDTAEMLDPDSLEKAASSILAAKSVRIFGVGASGMVGNDLHSKLMRINKNSYFATDHHPADLRSQHDPTGCGCADLHVRHHLGSFRDPVASQTVSDPIHRPDEIQQNAPCHECGHSAVHLRT